MRRILDRSDDTFRQWLAQYIVTKRVTLEQNFHSLYNTFLLFIDDLKLNQLVKHETLKNIKILLRSDKKQVSNFDDRRLLKNLGHWLGLITLARNQPIFFEDLNLRDLLFEAFYKGQQELLFVIPFVVKVIVSAGKSIVRFSKHFKSLSYNSRFFNPPVLGLIRFSKFWRKSIDSLI